MKGTCGVFDSQVLRFAALQLLLAMMVGLALASSITNAGDNFRDGWYPENPLLSPQLVTGGTFGLVWSTAVNGQVYAQPLLSNGTLLVATETNTVYGLDPATGVLRWPAPLYLGTPWNPANIGCGDLTPHIGVTSTPVIDPTTNTAYFTHKTYASGTSGPALWYMDAIDMATGTEKAGFPVQLSGTAQNQPGVTFSPTTQLQRSGLLLMDGVVYAGFGSHCDIRPWQGWVFGVSTAGHVRARWVDLTPGLNGAGIWQSGSGLMSDGSGTLLLVTGNGHSPSAPGPGSSPPATLGSSVVRLVVQPDGSLTAVDFFTPFDAEMLDITDEDLGSGGVTGLNEQYFGTPSTPNLAVTVGKEGYIYLMDRDSLGGFMQGPGESDNVVQRIGPYGGVWSRPGVWPGDGGWVYIPTASGGINSRSGLLRAYQYGVTGTDQPALSLQATSIDAFGFTSSAPVITSDGTTSGTALVWIIWTPDGSGQSAQLRAYDPVPIGGNLVLRWSTPIGTSSKFATPGVGAGKIYVGTRDGHVLGFGLLSTPILSGSTTSFPTTTIGSSSQKTATLTATNVVKITKFTSRPMQFTVGTPFPPLPAELSAGQTIQIPVTFIPTQFGLIDGQLTVETGSGNESFALTGTGQAAQAKLISAPTAISFGSTTVGDQFTSAVVFRNVGATPLTINAIILPLAPFSAEGMPEVGGSIFAGDSVTISISFDPTENGSFNGEFSLETTAGTTSVILSASASGGGMLQITSETNEYGTVAVGSTATHSFMVQNIGGLPVKITRSKPPVSGPFMATTMLFEGSTIAPGASIIETVTFTPTAPGFASAYWSLNGDDTTGLHEIAFTGTGTVEPPGAAWSYSGSAVIFTNGIRTTPATPTFLAGSGFFTKPLDSQHLIVEFDQTIGSGSGADGQTLTFADAGKAAPTALGAVGGGLGFSGIPGIAVAFDTFKNSVNPSANFVGLTDGPTSANTPDLLHWLVTNSSIPNLRCGVHHVKVETRNGTITVWIDFAQALSSKAAVALTNATAALASTVLLGFTGGTGGSTDVHQVENVVVSGDSRPNEPLPASLQVSQVVIAPSDSPEASTKLVVSGSCTSSFTTAPLGNGDLATPSWSGLAAGALCLVSEAAPSGSGWTTSASVNFGAEVTLTASAGRLTVPSFALVGGVNIVKFTNTYTGTSISIPDPTQGGWQLNSAASLTPTELVLTQAINYQAGSAFWPQMVNKRNLTIEFDASIGGGSGSDGLTMTIGDMSHCATPTSCGALGGGLGFSGIPGIAVALVTFKNSVNPSANFVGLTDGPTSANTPDLLHWIATANLAVALENATTKVKVVMTNNLITVFVNGSRVLRHTVTLPTSAYIGFTGGTGALNNRHAISNVVITST